MSEKKSIRQKMDVPARLGRQAKQSFTLGFADEIEDPLGAAIASGLSSDINFGDALTEARQLTKQQLSDDWQNYPGQSLTGQVIGGIPLAKTRLAQALAGWVGSGGKLQGVLKGMAAGAGYGGISGVGSAGDSVGERASGGTFGSIIGALLGGATAPFTRIGKPSTGLDYRKVTDKTAKEFANKAEQELAKQLAQRPDLPEQLLRAEAINAAAKKTGIPLTLAETVAQSSSDPLLAQQAVISGNPMTAGRMAQMYAARSGTPQQAGQIEQQLMRVAQQLDPSVGSYDDAAASIIGAAQQGQRDITGKLVAQAEPLYKAAYQAAVPEQVLQNPFIANAVKAVKSNPVFAQELQGAPDNSIRVLDAAKRYIDDLAEQASRSGARNESRLINQARDQLLKAMDAASPEYGQARAIYSGNPTALQMRESLGSLAGIDPMDAKSVNRALFSGTQQNAEIAAQALGPKAPTAAAARIYEAVDTLRTDPVNIAGRIAPDARTADMLRAYGGNALDETLDVINQAKLGERMRYGSPTQPRMEAEKGLENAANAVIDVATGGKTTLLRRVASFFGKGNEKTDPQFYADMADLMTTDKGMDLLRRVGSGQKKAIQELNTIGLPSLMAGSATRSLQMPTTQAAIGGLVTPKYAQDFSDIEAILNKKQDEDFSDIEAILAR